MLFAILLLLSYFLALILTKGLINYLSQKMLDVPNSRSSHQKPILRGGGLSFIAAFVVIGAIYTTLYNCSQAATPNFLFCNPLESIKFWQICLSLLPLIIIGFTDDLKNVSPLTRSLVQIAVAILIAALVGTVPVPGLENLEEGSEAKIVMLISVVAIVANINFYNFMDGIDGLLAGVTAIQLSFISLYLQQPIFLVLAVALAGFLYWNWSPAKIFMGDVGSTFLGATVAIALLSAHQSPSVAWSAFTVTLPLLGDAFYTLGKRLIQGKNIFQAHREHVYVRLQDSGFEHAQITIAYMVLTIVAAIVIQTFGIWSIAFNLLLMIGLIMMTEFYLASRLQQR